MNGGKITGCLGFPRDPQAYTDVCQFCVNLIRYSNGEKRCSKPYGGVDCYVWVTMPNGEVIGACDNFESIN